MCRSFQERVISVIVKKTMRAVSFYKVKNVVLAGGVAANSYLRERMTDVCNEMGINFSYPRMSYCTDNAAMIGAAAYYAYKKGIIGNLEQNAMAVDNLYNIK